MHVRRSLTAVFAVFAVLLLGSAVSASAQTKLLRFPDVHEDQLVFSYAGDLWLASTSGGTAARLTAHSGLELFPKFSPDGKWIAFTGQYDGDEQVYVIPVGGGAPMQLTFYPARGPLAPRWGHDNQVYGWTRDGKAILFRSMRDAWNLSETRLYTVPVVGGLPKSLPMPMSGGGDFSPDGRQVAYSPLARDFRTWKRYEGGWAQDLYIFDLESYEAEQVTVHPRTERDPMWIGDEIYFSSDRDGKLNLFAFDTDTKQTRQMTHNKTWDVRWPSSDNLHQVVYELNGELQVLDTQSGTSRHVSILVPNDGVAMRPARISTGDLVEDFELSPKGERGLFVARGDIFTVPIEKGPTRNLTQSSSSHDKWARWSPDGRKIAFVSDRDGEDEIYLVDQDGSSEAEQLTDGGRAMRYAPEWSPDGKRLAFSDKDGKVFVLTLEGRKLLEVADERRGHVRDYTWSPNGGHLAFTLEDKNSFGSIFIWSVQDAKLRRVTDEYFHETNPTWGPKGDFLFYLSDREFAPQLGSFEWNYAVDRETGIFAVALRKDVEHPFPPESDEVNLEAEKEDEESDEKDKKSKKDRKKKSKEYARIDFDGLAERAVRIPIAADNYWGLWATEDYLAYGRSDASFYGREPAQRPELRLFSFEDREETTLASDIRGFAISQDGKKVLVQHRKDYKLYDVAPSGKDSHKTVSTAGLKTDVVPAQEWAQVFDEVWRRYRDFFYVSNMHGYDWDALREQYRPLLEHVAHRSDLNYVLGEMIAELSVSHAYVAGGDYELPDRPDVALPGGRFELDPKANRYRLAQVFRGQNEEERYRAPLTEVGVRAQVGDYVLAIDGEELEASDNPYRLLRNKSDRPVQLTLNAKPVLAGAREVTFNPITSETDLIYLGWVASRRQKVSEMTEGRVGYIHLPNMGANGIREFIKWYYGQIRKEGLVVDVRSNGGGNVSQMIIERLRRDLLGTRFSRTSEDPGTYPAAVFHGHMVCLVDENSASDGDIFAHMFRQSGLGTLIGKRSWGGVIGITNRGTLLDGGSVYVPEFGTNAPNGDWVIEGRGVEPDLVIENDPKAVLAGRDPQLERGVEVVLEKMQNDPKKLPVRPPDPVRSEATITHR